MKSLVRNILFILTLSIFSISSFGQQTLASEKATQKLSAEVASKFGKGDISEAFSALENYWPIPQTEIDEVKMKTIKYMDMLQYRFGKFIASHRAGVEKIADFAIRETYILRFENHAIRLKFVYYKNDKGWIVNSFKWDDSFDEEFKEAE